MQLDPLTIAILAANPIAGVGYMQYKAGQEQVQAQRDAARKAEKQGVQNQNALVQQAYNKRGNALGLGEAAPSASPLGNAASQTGAVLEPGAVDEFPLTNLIG